MGITAWVIFGFLAGMLAAVSVSAGTPRTARVLGLGLVGALLGAVVGALLWGFATSFSPVGILIALVVAAALVVLLVSGRGFGGGRRTA